MLSSEAKPETGATHPPTLNSFAIKRLPKSKSLGELDLHVHRSQAK